MNLEKALSATLLSLAISGCAQQTGAPTHRWASAEAVDKAQYRQDHARCQNVANIAVPGARLQPDFQQFALYKQCMTTSGYELTATR